MNIRKLFLFALVLGTAVIANAQVVINEMLYETFYTSNAGCFTELKGTAGTSLDGYWLVGIDGASGAYDSVALTGTIPTSGYFVIAKDNTVANANQISTVVGWHQAGGSTGGSGDNVVLKNNGTIIDAVGYGNFVGPDASAIWAGFPTDNRYHSAYDPYPAIKRTAPADSVNQTLSRFPDGVNTQDNRLDFRIAFPTPGAANIWDAPTCVDRTLAQIRQNRTNGVPVDSGAYVRVSGTVCFPSGLLQTNNTAINVYIQDQTAGCNLYGISTAWLQFGDSITIQGIVIPFHGRTEIGSAFRQPYFTIINHGPAHVMPTPVDVTTAEMASAGAEAYEGMLVRLQNVQLVSLASGSSFVYPPTASANSKININDGTGQAVMFINKGSNWTGWTTYPAIGSTLTEVWGICDQYASTTAPPFSGGYEFSPRFISDFSPNSSVSETPIHAVVNDFRLESAYPNPFNRTTAIRYNISQGEIADIAVYDISGRLVANLASNLKAGNNVVFWNGRNLTGTTVAGGMYIIKMNGMKHTATMKAVYLP